MTQVLESTDPDLISEMFARRYAAMRMRIGGNAPLLRVAETRIGNAQLDRTTWRFALDGRAAPMEVTGIVRLRTGTVRYRGPGFDNTYGPGDTFFPVPPGPGWAVSLDNVESADILCLPVALLNDVAAATPAAETVRLLSDRPHSPAAAGLLWRTANTMRATVDGLPETPGDSLIPNAAARMLTAAVLTAFPNTAVREPTISDRHDAHPDTLRRATAFIDANPDLDITLADIAQAAHVTLRTVQIAFRRHLDTTPMGYLRHVRLQHARQQLLSATPHDDTTITHIALDWGFANPSHFAARYRAAYGESPRDTLNR